MTHLIITYGYLAVALLVGAESIGIPLPGETSLILAAIYAGHTHQLSVWIIFAVAAAAAVAIVAALFVVRRQAARLAQRAEAAYPGPLGQPGPPPAHPGAPIAVPQDVPSSVCGAPSSGDAALYIWALAFAAAAGLHSAQEVMPWMMTRASSST